MSKQRKKYSKEFKIQILREVETGTPVSQLSRQHEIQE
ncbi:transposase, partial [Candidatus Poribacteria bacterium]|nr:transposase [Candidatus Poribacteria bacterium]